MLDFILDTLKLIVSETLFSSVKWRWLIFTLVLLLTASLLAVSLLPDPGYGHGPYGS